jgi:hypothetical protein
MWWNEAPPDMLRLQKGGNNFLPRDLNIVIDAEPPIHEFISDPQSRHNH